MTDFQDNHIGDATLKDAEDPQHKEELLEAWRAFHPGEPDPPEGSICDFEDDLEDPPWPSD